MSATIASPATSESLPASQLTVLVLAIRIVGGACQAAIVMLVANALNIADMGAFSAAYVLWGLARMLGPLGLDQVAMREVTLYRASGDSASAAGVVHFATMVAAAGGAIIGLGALGLLATTGAAPLLSPSALLLVAAAAPAYALSGVLAAMLRCYDRNVVSQGIESLGLHVTTLALLLVHWRIAGIDLDIVLLWHTVAIYVSVVLYWYILRQARGGDVVRPGASARQRILRDGFNAWQALVLIGLSARVPTLLCISLLGPAATAILEIALRFGTLPTIVTTGVSTTFAPIVASQHARGDRAGLRHSLSICSWLGFVPAACVLLCGALVAPWLLAALFPPIFQSAYLPLMAIVAATTVNGAFGMSSIVLFMTGHERLVRLYSLLQLCVVTALSVGLGLLLGVTGIALAVLVGFIVFDVGLALRLGPMLGGTGFLRPSGLRHLGRELRGAAPVAAVERSQ